MIRTIKKAEATRPYNIQDLPPLIVGGAVFNNQYSTNPHNLPVKDILTLAFQHGLNAIDTSPYYGPSEEILGQALQKVEFARENYFICTKAGRVKLDDFDYSRENVRRSVERSLKRLNTDYLDLVYMHDIEFVEEAQIYEALEELKALKEEGVVKNFGISGYPIKFLYKIALGCKDGPVGPLDAILSYSNGCIQNERLFEMYDRFVNECQVKKVMNGSILSMSLLRSEVTHSFHPASQALKDKVFDIAAELKEEGVELADLATRFALKRWLFDGDQQSHRNSVVLGVSNIAELKVALDSYWQVKENAGGINEKDVPLYERVKKLLGEHFNETWESGIAGRG